jgi:hypothetical protein
LRVQIASRKARAGQRVRLHASLAKNAEYGYAEVFSAVKGFDPSPHVPFDKIGMTQKGQPMLLNCLGMRITKAVPAYSFEIIADENCIFFLMQDMRAGDIKLKGKVDVDGRLKEFFNRALGWFRRNR